MATASGFFVLRRSDDDIANTVQRSGEFREHEKFSDISVVSGGETFPCHKFELAKSSPVLEAMLLSEMCEATNNLIKLDHISSHIIKIILDYIYQLGEVTANEEDLVDLIVAADFLQMSSLVCKCLKQIKLIPQNVLSYYRLSTKLNLDDLKRKCLTLMKTDFAQITGESDFDSLDVSELIDYLKSVSVTASVNDEKLLAVFKWTAHDTDSRSCHLQDLLGNVQLDHCSLDTLIEIQDSFDMLLFSNRAVFQMLTKSLKNLRMSSASSYASSTSADSKTLIIVGGQVGNNPIEQEKCWRVNASNQLEEFSDIPYKIGGDYSMCQTSTGFIITGCGYDSKLCVTFDSSNRWRRLTDMNEARCMHGSVCVDNSVVYVMAGSVSGCGRSASVDFMSLQQGKWRRGPDLPEGTYYPKVSEVSGVIYLLDCENCGQLLQLDVSSSRWVKRKSCPYDDGATVSMCSVQGKLWVVGGTNRYCLYYSPATDTWSEAKHQPRLSHHYGSAVVWKHKLMLLGGRCQGGTNETEQMEVDEEIWNDSHITLPDGLHGHYAFVLDLPQ